MSDKSVGISSIGISIPKYYLPLSDLAELRSVPPEKYLDGLGCINMSLCGPDENAITLACDAAKKSLRNWNKDVSDIGLLVVATETAQDMSRPLSAWVMESLSLSGNIRSYEVKHACYAGTVAVRQAVEWILSGNSKGKSALVIASDVAQYSLEHSGEPTQGAGAIALIIGEPTIAEINPISYAWSESQYDFWRPVGNPYPEVNGRLSLSMYAKAVKNCFLQMTNESNLSASIKELQAMCFHVPFPKMVYRSFAQLAKHCNIAQEEIDQIYSTKIAPTMSWNQQIGNSYTASLWISVAQALTSLNSSELLSAFSYGSGCGSELLTIKNSATQNIHHWKDQVETDLASRQCISADEYLHFREK